MADKVKVRELLNLHVLGYYEAVQVAGDWLKVVVFYHFGEGILHFSNNC